MIRHRLADLIKMRKLEMLDEVIDALECHRYIDDALHEKELKHYTLSFAKGRFVQTTDNKIRVDVPGKYKEILGYIEECRSVFLLDWPIESVVIDLINKLDETRNRIALPLTSIDLHNIAGIVREFNIPIWYGTIEKWTNESKEYPAEFVAKGKRKMYKKIFKINIPPPAAIVSKSKTDIWQLANHYWLCDDGKHRHLFFGYDDNMEHRPIVKRFNSEGGCTVANYNMVQLYLSNPFIKCIDPLESIHPSVLRYREYQKKNLPPFMWREEKSIIHPAELVQQYVTIYVEAGQTGVYTWCDAYTGVKLTHDPDRKRLFTVNVSSDYPRLQPILPLPDDTLT